MKATQPKKATDPFTGFLASIALALLSSNMLAGYAVDMVGRLTVLSTPEIWKINGAAGFFVGVVLADPVGMLIQKRPVGLAIVKFILGFTLGMTIQTTFVMPLAGEGMSRYVFLILAALLLPILFVIESYKEYIRAHQISPGELIAKPVLRILNLPDRILFVFTMLISFAGFWCFGNDIRDVLVVIGSVLIGTALFVAFVKIESVPDLPWYYGEEDNPRTITLEEQAIGRLNLMFSTMLPGAVVLGGVMRIAVDVLLHIYPNIAYSTADPAETARVFGIVAASGLGFIVFGMLIALGFSLIWLLLIGRVGNWTTKRIRSRCLRLANIICFRRSNTIQ